MFECPSIVVSLLLMHVAFFVECSARGMVVTELHTLRVSSGSGVRCFVVRVVCRRGSDVQSVE